MGLFKKSTDGSTAASSAARRRDDETAFLGAQISVKGRVSGGGNLIVMGRLEGEFELEGEMIVAPPAVVTGEVRAGSVTISGTLTGTVAVRERIHLEKGAVVSGSLAGARLTVADGAVFNGEVAMKPPEADASTRGAGRG
jgi:cytoskeletal protein CcmA (bactofilin family)